MGLESVGTPLLWIGFTLFVLAMLGIDLGVFHRRAHEVSVQEALAWTCVWIALALLFNVGVYLWFGPQRGLEFFTGHLIEKALSVDNIFVFLVIFSYFAVPPAFQHRVLFWGIMGALIMRAAFILTGAALLQRWLHRERSPDSPACSFFSSRSWRTPRAEPSPMARLLASTAPPKNIMKAVRNTVRAKLSWSAAATTAANMMTMRTTPASRRG
ncbi:MAG: hypothetical protein FJW34_15050 [Acidobacteria bacterium]|nr:hypothetical protein [Acidobacteriota bacterium]